MLTTDKNSKKETSSPSTFKKVIRPQQDEVSVRFNVEEPKVRYLKINPFYRQSQAKGMCRAQPKIVPELRLCGNWLENAGFSPHDYVSVTVMDKLLIIRSTEELDDRKNRIKLPITSRLP